MLFCYNKEYVDIINEGEMLLIEYVGLYGWLGKERVLVDNVFGR